MNGTGINDGMPGMGGMKNHANHEGPHTQDHEKAMPMSDSMMNNEQHTKMQKVMNSCK